MSEHFVFKESASETDSLNKYTVRMPDATYVRHSMIKIIKNWIEELPSKWFFQGCDTFVSYLGIWETWSWVFGAVNDQEQNTMLLREHGIYRSHGLKHTLNISCFLHCHSKQANLNLSLLRLNFLAIVISLFFQYVCSNMAMPLLVLRLVRHS